MEKSIVPPTAVSVNCRLAMVIVTKLHPTLKAEESLKRNTRPSHNMPYKGYILIFKTSPNVEKPTNASMVPLLGGATWNYSVNIIIIMAYS